MKVEKGKLRIVQLDKINTLKRQGLGYYQCYCEKFAAKQQVFSMDKKDLCYDYKYAQLQVLFFKNLMTAAIVILNTVLRVINIFLVKRIGFNKESEVTMTIMTFVFYS